MPPTTPEIQPDSSAMIYRGELYWLPPDPARGSVPGHPHPHLVVQEDVINHSRVDTVVVCALTTNRNRANEPGNVLLDVGEGGLGKLSVVVVSQVSAVPKAMFGEPIGQLSERRVHQVLAGMRFQQTTYFRR